MQKRLVYTREKGGGESRWGRWGYGIRNPTVWLCAIGCLCESVEAEMADARQDMENRIRDFHIEAAQTSHMSHIACQTAWKTHKCTYDLDTIWIDLPTFFVDDAKDLGWPWMTLARLDTCWYGLITVPLRTITSPWQLRCNRCITSLLDLESWKVDRRMEAQAVRVHAIVEDQSLAWHHCLQEVKKFEGFEASRKTVIIFSPSMDCSANFWNGLPDFSQSTSWQSSRLYAFLSSMAGACAATTGHHPGSRDGEGENLWEDHD